MIATIQIGDKVSIYSGKSLLKAIVVNVFKDQNLTLYAVSQSLKSQIFWVTPDQIKSN